MDEFEEATRQMEEWGNSLEEICYDLKFIAQETVHDEYKVFIGETLRKLPKKVREKVFEDDVLFFAMGDDYSGLFTELNVGKPLKKCIQREFEGEVTEIRIKHPLIILNFAVMKNKPEMHIQSTIAHEIAHFYLGHKSIDAKDRVKQEKEADDLAVEWGFIRANKQAYKDKL